jgi:probable HAF family extracellular repeat protein
MRLLGLSLAATCAFYTLAPVDGSADSKKKPSAESISYDIEILPRRTVKDLNNKEELAVQGGEADGSSSVGIFVHRKGEVRFQCIPDYPIPHIRDTYVESINNHGAITGHCGTLDGLSQGFIRDAKGRIRTFRFPDADFTDPRGINDHEQVTGLYLTPFVPGRSGFFRLHSFIWTKGHFQTIDVAAPHPDDLGIANPLTITMAEGINNKGQVVGTYRTVNALTNDGGASHAFLYDNGQFTDISIPGVPSAEAVDINNNGQILLATPSATGPIAALYLEDDGHIFRINNPPGFLWVRIDGMNDKGQLVGGIREDREFRPDDPPLFFFVLATPISSGRK